jgi:citrate lyase subunit beta / citryl-CoA lyase
MFQLTSFLFVPANKVSHFFEKLATGDIHLKNQHSLIFDLEDSVPNPLKKESVKILAEILENQRLIPMTVPLFIRVNALDSGFLEQDINILREVLIKKDLGLMLSKCASVAHINYLYESLLAKSTKRIIPLIETLEGYKNREQIFSFSKQCHFPYVAFGAGDMSLELGIERDYQLIALQKIMADLLVESKFYKIPLLDSPSRILPKNQEGWEKQLVDECQWSVKNGFSAKMAVHPAQLAIIDAIFQKSSKLEAAKRLLTLYGESTNTNAIKNPMTGDYIGLPTLKMAKNITFHQSTTTGKSHEQD